MKVAKSKGLALLIIFSLLLGLIGIAGPESAYAATKKIHLKSNTITIATGKTYQQKLIAKNGKTIKATKIKWKSSKTSIAKIDKKGKVKAVKKGTAKMTAKYNGKTYKFTVKVRKPQLNAPTITSVKRQRYKSDGDYYNSLFVRWTTVKDATRYKLYIARNGGKYEYEGTYTSVDSKKYQEVDCGFCQPEPEYQLSPRYKFKVIAINGKYKSKYSNEKSFTTPKTAYSKKDVAFLLDSVGYGVDFSMDFINMPLYWAQENYSQTSSYVERMRDSASAIYYDLEAAKDVTAVKTNRKCKTSRAAESGFKTWDGMMDSLLKRCKRIENANVKSMSDDERKQFAKEIIIFGKDINVAYLEIYDYY